MKRFSAFLSYTQKDLELANWLHQRLSKFRIPDHLRGRYGRYGVIPSRLAPVYIDTQNAIPGVPVEQSILDGLENSDSLIVLCSPRAANSPWISAEIERFCDAKPASPRIIPVIVGGVPNSRIPETECLPPPLRDRSSLSTVDFRTETTKQTTSMAATREKALQQVGAALLGVDPSELSAPLVERYRRHHPSSVFISYRRADTGQAVGRFYDTLCKAFGRRRVFLDVDKIPLGVDFKMHILEVLRNCRAVLVLVGPNWIADTRILDPDDPVRLELEIARALEVPIFPVLVEGAKVPASSQLPENLSWFCDINAMEVDLRRDFHRDVSRVISAMKR